MLQADLPTFSATWWPLMLETVPGSREQLTVASLVRTESGQMRVRQLITPGAIHSMFGSAGSGMKLVIVKTVLELQRQLDQGVAFEALQFPFGGLHFGPPRDCIGSDLNEVFEVAFRLGGAFGMSTFGRVETPSTETRRAFDEWADKVRVKLLAVGQEDLHASFNVNVTLMAQKKARIGFIHDGYAAQFGVLRPGRTASTDMRALAQRTELIIGYPTPATDSPFTQRELNSQRDSWDFVLNESKNRGVTALRYGHAHEAASHLLQITIAA
jgi:hypothetical protein